MNFFALKSYAWIAYAVSVEKYTHNVALQTATIILFNIPLTTGNVPWIRFVQFWIRNVLGIGVKPFVSSPWERLAFTNRM